MADAKGILSAILWFLGLWLLAWPIGFICAWIYVLLVPFTACIKGLEDPMESLLRIVKLPLTFAQNMVNCKSCC